MLKPLEVKIGSWKNATQTEGSNEKNEAERWQDLLHPTGAAKLNRRRQAQKKRNSQT